MRAEREGVSRLRLAAPVLDHEAERRAALFQAAAFQAAELEGPGQRDRRGGDQPAVPGQRGNAGDEHEQRGVKHVRRHPERAPHRHVAQAQQHEETAVVLAPGRQASEGIEQGQRGRQHHRRGHQDPRRAVEQRRHDQVARRNGAAQERGRPRLRPVAVVEVASVRAARPSPQRQPGERDQRGQQRGEDAPMAEVAERRRRQSQAHASKTNVLCRALWFLMSTSMPMAAFLDR